MVVNEIGLMKRFKGEKAIIQSYETYEHAGRYYIAVELMNYSLMQLLEVYKGKINERALKYICKQILLGLKAIHSKNIIHRDMKSDNILVNLKGDVKIADFGLSTNLTSENKNRTTLQGTMHWTAPEIFDLVPCYDEKIDIWSYGIICYELAMGLPPTWG
jgi:serine/threonine protein kinase